MPRTKNKAKREKTFNIIPDSDRGRLKRGRQIARIRGDEVVVPEYTYHRGSLGKSLQRLARQEDLENAVRRLCKHRDKQGRMSGDAVIARNAIAFLEDTFLTDHNP